MRPLLAVAALLSLAACTPEEIAAVEAHYRASIEAVTERAPSITVDDGCGTLTVHAENWPDGSAISVGIESQPGFILHPVDGTADGTWTADNPHSDLLGAYYWSVVGLLPGAHEAAVTASGTAPC